jgi:hypothetical protein
VNVVLASAVCASAGKKGAKSELRFDGDRDLLDRVCSSERGIPGGETPNRKRQTPEKPQVSASKFMDLQSGRRDALHRNTKPPHPIPLPIRWGEGEPFTRLVEHQETARLLQRCRSYGAGLGGAWVSGVWLRHSHCFRLPNQARAVDCGIAPRSQLEDARSAGTAPQR